MKLTGGGINMELKQEILNNLSNRKLTLPRIVKIMHIKGEEMRASFLSALNELEIEGKIYLDDKGYYQTFKKSLNKVQGEINISKYGNGSVEINKGKEKIKYIIEEENIAGALNGDIVVLKDIQPLRKNYNEAKVEKVIKRNNGLAIFEYNGEDFIPYGIKNKIKILCPKSTLKGIVTGSRVLVKLDKEQINTKGELLIYGADIQKIIGHKDDPGIEIESIAAKYGFLKEFPKEVMAEVAKIKDEVLPEEIEGRKDLRDEMIFTIDGKDTKDMDDAVSLKKDENGNYILGVHIADVSHYVKEGSALFNEAFKRGTSAYLIDSVVPMLPHELSNGICSLNPNADRLTKTAQMTITPEGKIIDCEIFDSVIRSRKKMTYESVNQILERNINVEGYEEYIDTLKSMQNLSQILSKNSQKRGNIDFYSDELKVKVTKEGSPLDFIERRQGAAEKLIENFMIAANESVTKYFSYMDVPFIYRIHAVPNGDKLIKVLKTLKEEELSDNKVIDRLINKISNNNYTSKDLKEFLETFKSQKETYSIISNLLLRGMSKAVYSDVNEGHYGLSLKYYTHFTSPIRRFPDLMVHHLINHYQTFENLDGISKSLPDICSNSSFMERRADDAEKEAVELKMAEYMENHIGEIFTGRVTNISPRKMDIKLLNQIRGIASPQDIIRKPNNQGINPKYKLGDRVYALVKEVDIPNRTIYFVISKTEIHALNQEELTHVKELKKNS